MPREMNVFEAERADLMPLYEWSKKTNKIQSQYGHITYEEWINREYARISSDPKRTAAVVTYGPSVTLYVNDVFVRTH